MTDAPQKPKSLQLHLPEDVAGGVYSNLTLVNHSQGEFIVDFVFVQPMEPKARVRSRVVVTPQHAKRIAAAMADNINRYEARFGPIAETAAPDPNVH